MHERKTDRGLLYEPNINQSLFPVSEVCAPAPNWSWPCELGCLCVALPVSDSQPVCIVQRLLTPVLTICSFCG